MRFVNLTLVGISNGMIYAAVALAIVLIWRATRVINFAQGAMLMFTTFIAKEVIDQTGSYWWGFAAALAFGFLFGGAVELLVVRPVENKPPLNAVIVTLGLLILLQAAAGMLWGVQPESFPPPFGIRGYEIGNTRLLFTSSDLFIVCAVAGLAILLLLLFRGTSLGLRMRAAAFEPEVARMLGVRVGVMLTLGWALAAVAGALAGILIAPQTFLGPYQFDAYLVYGFTAAVIGGLDSPLGGVVGGLVLGLTLSYLAGYVDTSLTTLGALGVLLVGPDGPTQKACSPVRRREGCEGALMSTDDQHRNQDHVQDDDLRERTEGDVVQAAHRRGPQAPGGAQIPRAWAWAREHTLVWHLLVLLLGFVLVYFLTESLSPFRNVQVANVAYLLCAAAGLTVLVGLNGQISLGHGAFMAVGAYTTGLLTQKQGWGIAATLVAATVVTALVGVVVGAAAARLRGPYLAGATLAFAVGLPAIVNWHPVEGFLGADTGLTFPVPQPPSSIANSVSLQEWQAWFCSIGALLTLFFLANLARSRVGRNFRAVRDDEVAAQLSGLNIARVQITAFIVSAACAGLGGGLLALANGLAAPGAFGLTLSLTLLSAIIIGGLGSLAGAVYGSLVLVFLPQWANNFGASHNLSTNIRSNIPIAIYGGMLILVMLLFSQGIQGGLRRLVRLGVGGVARLRSRSSG